MSKIVKILGFLTVLFMAIYFSYPSARDTLHAYSISYYNYEPKNSIKSQVDISHLEPARAVPILMYHGILNSLDLENTQHQLFIQQMEMLKREGYQTISLAQFDQFRQSKLTLPPKPIIITFDDGRKDSYFPTDDIFKKLGFKATIFIATIKANNHDKFYLSWDELKHLQSTKRWEIEAHGRNSHDRVVIGEKGEIGRFLTSKIFHNNIGLETDEEFRKRVEQDYKYGIEDLQKNLNLNPKYYAVPLNDFGVHMNSNYPQAYEFNQEMVRKYLKMAFVEEFVYAANLSDQYYKTRNKVYNYPDDDPYTLRRVEVKNMPPEKLKKLLEDESPRNSYLELSAQDIDKFKQQSVGIYGDITFDQFGLNLKSNSENESAKVLFGKDHWKNYTIEAKVSRITGRSVVIFANAKDSKTGIMCGATDTGVFLREEKDDTEKDLATSKLIGFQSGRMYDIKLTVLPEQVTCLINNTIMLQSKEATLKQGFAGFKIWDDKNKGIGTLQSIKITPN